MRVTDQYAHMPCSCKGGGRKNFSVFCKDFTKKGVIYDATPTRGETRDTTNVDSEGKSEKRPLDLGWKEHSHRVPRKMLFKPDEVDDCPVPITMISDRKGVHRFRTGHQNIIDNWKQTGDQ